MQKTILIILAACLASCAAPGPSQEALEAATKEAMMAQVICAHERIASVDDGISDAQSVALALSIACNSEYHAATVAMGHSMLNNDRQRRMWAERRSTQQTRIENFLPSVMRYRSQR